VDSQPKIQPRCSHALPGVASYNSTCIGAERNPQNPNSHFNSFLELMQPLHPKKTPNIHFLQNCKDRLEGQVQQGETIRRSGYCTRLEGQLQQGVASRNSEYGKRVSAHTFQSGKCPKHKCECGWETEWLICCNGKQVLPPMTTTKYFQFSFIKDHQLAMQYTVSLYHPPIEETDVFEFPKNCSRWSMQRWKY
jgi:hypothetical protein